MRLSQACGLRSEIIVEGSDGCEDREVKTDSSRRGGIEVGGLSGRSVKVPGELLHTVSRRRRMWWRAAEGRWNAAAGWPLGRTSGGASCQGLQQGRPHQRSVMDTVAGARGGVRPHWGFTM